jgi:putative endonuclease
VTDARLRLGRAAEELVAGRLSATGLKLIARNARVRDRDSGLVGELDLIAQAKGTLVFIEVKAGRSCRRAGPERPALAVGRQKQRQLRRLARAWLAEQHERPRFAAIRFDVVGVTYGTDGSAAVEWIRDAF